MLISNKTSLNRCFSGVFYPSNASLEYSSACDTMSKNNFVKKKRFFTLILFFNFTFKEGIYAQINFVEMLSSLPNHSSGTTSRWTVN